MKFWESGFKRLYILLGSYMKWKMADSKLYYNNGIKFTYHKFFPIPNTQGIVFEYAIIE